MTAKTTSFMRDVYIVDGARSPFLKAKGKPGPFSASVCGGKCWKAGTQPFQVPVR